MQLTLTDDDEIGVKRAESQVFSRSAATYHLEFCTNIALRGNCLESLANRGGHTFVRRRGTGKTVGTTLRQMAGWRPPTRPGIACSIFELAASSGHEARSYPRPFWPIAARP